MIFIKRFFINTSGQGITEYGALIAFIGVLISVALMSGQGTVQNAVKGSFSAITTNITLIK